MARPGPFQHRSPVVCSGVGVGHNNKKGVRDGEMHRRNVVPHWAVRVGVGLGVGVRVRAEVSRSKMQAD